MFAAVLFPGSSYPMNGHVGQYDGARIAKEAGPLFDPGRMFGTRRWFAAGLAAPECSLIVLTEHELIARSGKFDVYSGGVNQGLASVGDELARWRRSDVSIRLSFTKMELQRTQRMMVGDIDLQNHKVRVSFENRALGQSSIMNCFVRENEEQRARAWVDRSVLGGNWTADFACFAEWWAANPDSSVST